MSLDQLEQEVHQVARDVHDMDGRLRLLETRMDLWEESVKRWWDVTWPMHADRVERLDHKIDTVLKRLGAEPPDRDEDSELPPVTPEDEDNQAVGRTVQLALHWATSRRVIGVVIYSALTAIGLQQCAPMVLAKVEPVLDDTEIYTTEGEE